MTARTLGDTRLPASFWAKVTEDQSGCWLWTGPARLAGYGSVWFNGVKTSSHRLSYEVLIGAVPDGLELDHLCRRPACVNPTHMEPVTHAENMRRASAAKTTCRQGHKYDDANGRRRANGRRLCQPCRVERRKRYRASQRLQAS